jgi:hypothetical protein
MDEGEVVDDVLTVGEMASLMRAIAIESGEVTHIHAYVHVHARTNTM